jgi:hypothetical protein
MPYKNPLKKLFNIGRTRTQTRNTKQNGKKGNNKQTKQKNTRPVSSGPDNVFNNERIINFIDTKKKYININFKTNISQLSNIDLYAKYYIFNFKNEADGKENKDYKIYKKILNSHPYKSLNVYTNNILNIIKEEFKNDTQKHSKIISFYNIFTRKLTSISLLIYVIKEFSKQNIFENDNLNNYINKIEPLLIKLNDNVQFKTYDEIIYFTIHLIKDYFKSVYYLLKILSFQLIDNNTIYNYIIDYSIVYTSKVDLGLKTNVKSNYQNGGYLPILISAIIGEMMTRLELILFVQFMPIYYTEEKIKLLEKYKHCLIINKITKLTDDVIYEFNETNLNLLFDEINNLDNNVGLILPKSFNDIETQTQRNRTKVVISKNPNVNLQRKNALQNCKNLSTPLEIPKAFKINKYYTFDKNIFNNINKEIATLHGYYNNNNFEYALKAARNADLEKEKSSLERRRKEKTELEKRLSELKQKLSKKQKTAKITATDIVTIANRKNKRSTMALPDFTQPNSLLTNSLKINNTLFTIQGKSPNLSQGFTKQPSLTRKKPIKRQTEMHNVPIRPNNMSGLEDLLKYMNSKNAKKPSTRAQQSPTTPDKETAA